MKRLALLLSALALVVAAGGVTAVATSDLDVAAEVGKWLLGLATALAVTGALSSLVKQVEERRTGRAAWEARLREIVAAKQAVVVCRLLLRAHKTASTYRDQLAQLIKVRVQLRDIMADAEVIARPELRSMILRMKDYIDDLGREYEAGYLQVARQQLVDEQRLKQLVAEAVASATPTSDPMNSDLGRPLPAWRMLEDPKLFPKLTDLLDDDTFNNSPFSNAATSAYTTAQTRARVRSWREAATNHQARQLVTVLSLGSTQTPCSRSEWPPSWLTRQSNWWWVSSKSGWFE